MSGETRTLGLKDLMEALAESGLPSSRWWLYNAVRTGKLSLPKQAHASKRYQLTWPVIAQVVEGLKTKGEYHYKGGESTNGF